MSKHRWHKLLGLVLFIPLICWSLTGVVFLFKPGYAKAYQKIDLQSYAIAEEVNMPKVSGAHQIRLLRTILGDHLLVNVGQQWRQVDLQGTQDRPQPSHTQMQGLLADAIAHDLSRYGHISSIDGLTAQTDTGVELSLNWSTMTLRQRGRGTRLIGLLYKIHYLQWLGLELPNKILGGLGILILLVLSTLGVFISVRKN